MKRLKRYRFRCTSNTERIDNHLDRQGTTNRQHQSQDTTKTDADIWIELQTSDNAFVEKYTHEKAKKKSNEGTFLLMSAYRVVADVKQGREIRLVVLEEILLEFFHSKTKIGHILQARHSSASGVKVLLVISRVISLYNSHESKYRLVG